MGVILTEPVPASPEPQGFPGAYRPGTVPGAAAGQYGAPLAMPGGPVVAFSPVGDTGRCPGCGQFRVAGQDHQHGKIITGSASGD